MATRTARPAEPAASIDVAEPKGDADLLLRSNAIDEATGEPWPPPVSARELASVLGKGPIDDDEREFLTEIVLERRAEKQKRHRILMPLVEPRDLEATGWGVIFPEKEKPGVHDTLGRLLKWRQLGVGDGHFKIYRGQAGYRAGESVQMFLARHGGNTGPVDPTRIPYYLLLVGGPEEIPYHFQSQLAVRHAVGRIAFEALDGYRRYAENVVRAERRREVLRRPGALFFSAANAGDKATQEIHQYLIKPIERKLALQERWDIEVVAGREASRERLIEILRGGVSSLLFTASHGLAVPDKPRRQRKRQGALLCGGWPGYGPVLREHALAAADLPPDISLLGKIIFLFACYSAGTPRFDNFAFCVDRDDPAARLRREAAGALGLGEEIAPQPFVAALPQTLLSAEEGPLAVIGHVDRGWTTSFSFLGDGREAIVFESILEELATGAPAGHAMQYMSLRYAELASDIAEVEDPSFRSVKVSPLTRARMWCAANDARNFIVLGDPAVRLSRLGQPRRLRDGRRTPRSTRSQLTR